jgi:hemerythrin superfamily protein
MLWNGLFKVLHDLLEVFELVFNGEVHTPCFCFLRVKNKAGKEGVYLEVLIYFDVRVF